MDAFYHQLCPDFAALQQGPRDARTDLAGRRALLTGGRAKIGMHIALRLLRDGAHTTITTRFPADAVRRFTSMPDSADWMHRLGVVGIDLRDPAQVVALADEVAARGPLDILINNAAQTVRRSPGRVRPAGRGGVAPSCRPARCPRSLDLGHGADLHPRRADGGRRAGVTAHALAALALTSGSASLERVADRPPSTRAAWCPTSTTVNSWTRRVEQVDALELLEVQLCNVHVAVRARQPAPPGDGGRAGAADVRREHLGDGGVIQPRLKAGHPHTNMAKAAMNMVTRTSGKEMLETDGILMTCGRHRLDHRRAPAPAPRSAYTREGFTRPARPGRRRGPGLRPGGPRRARRGPLRRASSRTTPAPPGRPPVRRRRLT